MSVDTEPHEISLLRSDEIVQLREVGTNRARPLPANTLRFSVGTRDDCSERLSGPSRAARLRGFLERLLGWDALPAVERALRSVKRAMDERVPLVFHGDGDLMPIAQALHRRTIGADRPFVLADPRRGNTPTMARAPMNYASGGAAFAAATEGTLCVRSRRPPRDFARVMELIRDPSARVWLMVCSDSYERCDVLLAVSEPIRVPPLATRASELPRIVEEYAEDARAALSTSVPFTQNDRDWVVTHCASLHEIELATLRLVAIHHAGNVACAAKLLGMSHGGLGEWFAKRRTKLVEAEADRAVQRAPRRRVTREAAQRGPKT